MNDIILESIRVCVLLGVFFFLLRAGSRRSDLLRKGWFLIIWGFGLLLFGTLLDITDNFESLNRFVVIGDTPVEAFLEKLVGFLGGFLLLAIGLIRWIPTVTSVEQTNILAKNLEKTNKELILSKEKAEESNRLKSEFLNTMNHELRTPITIMLGNIPLLTNPDDLPDSHETANIALDIEKSGKHLLALVNDLLDLSKIEAGKMELSIQTLLITSLVEKIVYEMEVAAKKKGLKIETHIEDLQIKCDPSRLKQILFNLLSNAIKFTNHGRIIMNVKKNSSNAVFEVIDTGCGIYKADLSALFKPFRQVDNSTTRKVGGTGLGLAITKKFVEMHKGKIWVQSKPGEGSVFTFSIPCV